MIYFFFFSFLATCEKTIIIIETSNTGVNEPQVIEKLPSDNYVGETVQTNTSVAIADELNNFSQSDSVMLDMTQNLSNGIDETVSSDNLMEVCENVSLMSAKDSTVDRTVSDSTQKKAEKGSSNDLMEISENDVEILIMVTKDDDVLCVSGAVESESSLPNTQHNLNTATVQCETPATQPASAKKAKKRARPATSASSAENEEEKVLPADVVKRIDTVSLKMEQALSELSNQQRFICSAIHVSILHILTYFILFLESLITTSSV
jgi:hypothetical protein